MMNLRQIEAFYMVAKNNSFSKAARELHLTQPTISTNITNLEKELGKRDGWSDGVPILSSSKL